jgi:CobQ-like glutamine amidotransferase family enzyme
MKTQQENTTTWSECKCEACTSETETETKTEAKGFENHQGDGPSGYDYFSDTRRWC